jgi:ACS family tartrate transporter-like MFS transporter
MRRNGFDRNCAAKSNKNWSIADTQSLQALASGRVWHLILIYFGMMISLYALNSWAPLLVKSLSSSYSNSMVGLFLPIPYLFGLAGLIFICYNSDRTAERRYHVAVPSFAAAVALVLLGAAYSTFLTIVLLSFVAIGGGLVGPYIIGAIAMRTGNLYGGLALAGIFSFISAILVLLLPRKVRGLAEG